MERKHIADRNRPRASNILSYRIVGFIKIHDFRHSRIFHGDPWVPMGTPWGPHGFPWVPMGPMGTHGFPWIFHELSGRPQADKKCPDCVCSWFFIVFDCFSLFFMVFQRTGSMGTDGDPWDPMGTHGTHGNPWGPMGTHRAHSLIAS